ncbi:MAG: aminotransferase class I/II-fold pyridoxal phosphate-dependent enzyme [Lachnospiraceae bacterium]|nr:aminotransferase class I/II-fold pyridoxal phosphate-dependent enzyme [Lachnospiraceae bacterium]
MADKKKIYLASPTMHGDELKYIHEAFDTNWVAPLGANVNGFEADMEKYIGHGMHAAALASGTAAIHLAFRLIGLRPGDIVFGSSLTFAATVNPITYDGGVPVFIDSERDSWNMDPRALEAAFEKYPNVKAVICANLYGTPAKLDELEKICEDHGAVFIEDAAESLGATYNGVPTGTFGKFGTLSFNGNKIITTSGGGMLLTHDEELKKKATFLATQARENERWYEHKEIGFNYRMSNIVAGIGRGQMEFLDEHVALKKKIRDRYAEGFKDISEIKLNPYIEGSEPNYWLTCMTIEEGSNVSPFDVMDALAADNIETRPIWKPMHMQPVYKDNGFVQVEEGISVGEDIFNRGLCLPSDIKNTDEDMDRIISIIRKCFGK